MNVTSHELPRCGSSDRSPPCIVRVGCLAGARGASLALGLMALIAASAPASAQWLDAQHPRGGELLIGLAGTNGTVDRRFQPDGSTLPLADVLSLEVGSDLYPALDTLQARLPGLFARFNVTAPESSTLGVLKFDVLLERTSAPLTLAFGLTDWLTVFGVAPIVKAESYSGSFIDGATASAAPVGSAFGADATALLGGLEDGIGALQSLLDGGMLSPERQQLAQSLLTDARAMESGLTGLAELQFVPTDSSTAGQQITAAYEAIRAGFAEFEVMLPDLSLGQPDADFAAAAITESEFGIVSPHRQTTGIKLGDVEAGLSLQPFDSFRRETAGGGPWLPLRLRLDALWRFPTGSAPVPRRLTDLGTGDGQADLELRSTVDVGFGDRLWLSLFGGYTIQFDAELQRLLTSPEVPIQIGARVATVSWDPGDVLRLAVLPRVNLTRAITFSGIFMLVRHQRDVVTATDSQAETFNPADLEEGTEFTAHTLGFAARYSSTDWHGARRSGLPVEVELRYTRTVSARDGFVPQRNTWELGLRYYQSIFR